VGFVRCGYGAWQPVLTTVSAGDLAHCRTLRGFIVSNSGSGDMALSQALPFIDAFVKTVAEARANREMLTLTRKIASTVVHIPARCSNCGACS
jgi:hypothetical protein